MKIKYKGRIFIIIAVMFLFLTACSENDNQDETVVGIVNSGESASENLPVDQSESLTEEHSGSQAADQMAEKEIICENPYFFPRNVSSLTADITFFDIDEFATIRGDLELRWLKQYESGCIAKLSLLPFDNMPEYLSEEDINFYFYVTADEIYRIYNYILQDSEYTSYAEGHLPNVYPLSSTIEHVYAYEDEALFFDLLDSDEKILENAELICCLEGVESDYIRELEDIYAGDIGILYEIVVSENQITYRRYEYPVGSLQFFNSFVWESGRGLSRYRTGYRAGALALYIENIIAEPSGD